MHPARGSDGGHDGAKGRASLKSGATLRGFGRQVIPAGDRVVLETPGGAGIGDPRKRARAKLDEDVRDGLVSVEQAGAAYGLK